MSIRSVPAVAYTGVGKGARLKESEGPKKKIRCLMLQVKLSTGDCALTQLWCIRSNSDSTLNSKYKNILNGHEITCESFAGRRSTGLKEPGGSKSIGPLCYNASLTSSNLKVVVFTAYSVKMKWVIYGESQISEHNVSSINCMTAL